MKHVPVQPGAEMEPQIPGYLIGNTDGGGVGGMSREKYFPFHFSN